MTGALLPDWLRTASALPPGAWPIVLAALGACLGSFLNVVIHRLPRGESLIRPRSRCPGCGEPVRPRDNVPVLGWLLLRGRCRDCGATIPVRYPLVELSGAVALLAALPGTSGPPEYALRALLLLGMIVVFWIDLDHRLILDVLTLPGAALGLIFSPLLGTGRLDAVVGAVGAGLALEGLRRAWIRFRGVDGLGGGDVKLAVMLGAWLGWQGVAVTFLLGSLAGAAVGLALVARGRAAGTTALPYGVFLAPAAAIVVLWGGEIWSWYIALGA